MFYKFDELVIEIKVFGDVCHAVTRVDLRAGKGAVRVGYEPECFEQFKGSFVECDVSVFNFFVEFAKNGGELGEGLNVVSFLHKETPCDFSNGKSGLSVKSL